VNDLLTSLRLWIVTLVVCCVLYPGFLWLFGHALVPGSVQGDLARDPEGYVIGSRRLAQSFSRPEYLWPRPSAVDYNASAAGGSNLSPTDPRLTERARKILARLGVDEPVPADLLAASGSGLDPDITERAARLQAPRIAEARGIDEGLVQDRIDDVARVPGGIPVGERLVNVLELNLTLDGQVPERGAPGAE
jgi:K+-transporting ATPase ATPase C chain